MASLAGLGVAGVVVTAADVQAAISDEDYFRGSIRLWVLLAMIAAALTAAVAPALVLLSGMPAVWIGALALPSAVAVGGCLANAWSLSRVQWRRRGALAQGDEVDAIVVARERKAFAPDILRVTVETRLPIAGPALPPARSVYRDAAPEPSPGVQLVETCPGDQWSRLPPGTQVRVRVDPSDSSRYALVL